MHHILRIEIFWFFSGQTLRLEFRLKLIEDLASFNCYFSYKGEIQTYTIGFHALKTSTTLASIP
jgi:hypothetical protein